MVSEHEITSQVYAAKADMQKADALIRAYIPYIRKAASQYMERACTEQDDELSIAMIAFHEAIQGYKKEKGSFLAYASLLIKNRLIDYHRKQERHQNVLSLEEERGEEKRPLGEQLADTRDYFEESTNLEATRQEIQELSSVMESFGVSFTDVSEHSPKQERTLEACTRAIRYGAEQKDLLDELLQTKKLPLAQLVKGSGVERKTLERHRKYVLAMLLIQTNGYEIIRGHLHRTLAKKGGMPV